MKKDKNEEKELSEEEALILSEFFRIFGDSTRIRIIGSLFDGEKCVSNLSESLNISQSAISHQLKVLRQGRLVKYKRKSKQVYYSLDDAHIKTIFNIGLEHINEKGEK